MERPQEFVLEKKMSKCEVVVGGTYRDWKGDLYSVFSKIPIKSKFKKGTTLGASMGFSLCETDLNPGDVGIVYGHSTQRFIQEESNFLEILGDKDEGTMYYRFELVSIQDSGQDSKLEAAEEALEAARELQQMRRSHGVGRIKLLVPDVDSDWLENWDEPPCA
jgi:hypothetical protein